MFPRKKSTDDIKQRLQSVIGYSLYVVYLGFEFGPDPGASDFSFVNLLPIG